MAPAAPSPDPGITRTLEFRTRLGISQEQAAARAGVCLKTYRRIESGRGVLTAPVRVLIAVAHALGVAPADLMPALRHRPVRPRDRR